MRAELRIEKVMATASMKRRTKLKGLRITDFFGCASSSQVFCPRISRRPIKRHGNDCLLIHSAKAAASRLCSTRRFNFQMIFSRRGTSTSRRHTNGGRGGGRRLLLCVVHSESWSTSGITRNTTAINQDNPSATNVDEMWYSVVR